MRKAEIPQYVIWIAVYFAAANIATGFLQRIGTVLADEGAEFIRNCFTQLGGYLRDVIKKRKEDKRTDVIFGIPIAESHIVVEGIVEDVDSVDIVSVLQKLPLLYAIAVNLIRNHRPDYFREVKFIFNPEAQKWEINYLITKDKTQMVKGPRYYDQNHPLQYRYRQFLQEVENLSDEELGMSIGGFSISELKK